MKFQKNALLFFIGRNPFCKIVAYKRLCCVAFLCLFASCREQIVHNISEYEANRLLSSLEDLSIDAAKEKQVDGSWAISVPSNDSLRAIKFVSDSRLVREPVSAVAGKSSLVMSRDEQRFAYERGLSREIETTLLSVPGVLEARVHLNIPSSDPLLEHRSEDSHGTASVLLLIEGQRLVAREDIATLVSGASGVPITSVAVVVAEDVRVPAVIPAASLPADEKVPEDMAARNLFSADPKLNPADVGTSITVTGPHHVAGTGMFQSLKDYFSTWLSNLSIVRLLIISILIAGIGGLYWYARRMQRGTGVRQFL